MPAPHLSPRVSKTARDQEFEERRFVREIGVVGKFLGASTEKSSNIAAIMLFLLVILLFGVIFYYPHENHFESTLGGVISLITLIIGYLLKGSTSKE